MAVSHPVSFDLPDMLRFAELPESIDVRAYKK
jgi:hypothetical protein